MEQRHRSRIREQQGHPAACCADDEDEQGRLVLAIYCDFFARRGPMEDAGRIDLAPTEQSQSKDLRDQDIICEILIVLESHNLEVYCTTANPNDRVKTLTPKNKDHP